MVHFFCRVNLLNQKETCNNAGVFSIKSNSCIKHGIIGEFSKEGFACCPISIFGGEV